jgi:hypothetical protein
MSAYVVSDNHINELVRFIDSRFYQSMGYLQRIMLKNNVDTLTLSGDKLFEAIGQELLKENYLSVNHRYLHLDILGKAHKFHYRPELGKAKLKPVVILKLVNCLDYQSCEHEGWPESAACKILESIKSHAIHQLEGYDAAPWGIN